MEERDYLNRNGFIDGDDLLIDEVVSSAESYKDVAALCGRIKNPKSLKRQQKERIVKKLIKFSKTYDEILNVKFYAEELLHYSLTDKQVWRLIEKLVCASSDDNQLKEVKKYARSKGFLSRYMKAVISKRIAEVYES